MRADFKVEHVVDDAHVLVPFVAILLVGEDGEVEVPEALLVTQEVSVMLYGGRMVALTRFFVTCIVAGLIPFDKVL